MEQNLPAGVQTITVAWGGGSDPAPITYEEAIRLSDVPAIEAAVEERIRKRLEEPIHTLASTIGRGRVFADNDEPKLARRELDDASEAMGRLRFALRPDEEDHDDSDR